MVQENQENGGNVNADGNHVVEVAKTDDAIELP